MPGNNGGANWGGSAVDPTDGMFYVVSKDLPAMLKLEPEGTAAASLTGSPEERGEYVFEQNCKICPASTERGSHQRFLR